MTLFERQLDTLDRQAAEMEDVLHGPRLLSPDERKALKAKLAAKYDEMGRFIDRYAPRSLSR